MRGVNYGRQHAEVAALLSLAARLPDEYIKRVADFTYLKAHEEQLLAAYDALDTLCGGTPRGEAVVEVMETARNAEYLPALALVARDLVAPTGFTQAHYDTLTLAWRVAVGPLHPDDQDMPDEQRPTAVSLVAQGFAGTFGDLVAVAAAVTSQP
jgi:hypothetical protein